MNEKDRNRTLVVLFAGVLMGALDIAIVGPALPAIQHQFGLDARAGAWIFTGYVLANLIATPLMARLSDQFGRRAVYLADVGLFALGSLVVVASATNAGWFWMLMLGRFIQGFGAGGIFPVASAVIGDAFPAETRGRALGLIGSVFGLAFLLGPFLGGLLLGFGWWWLFAINLPVAAVVIWLAWRVLPSRPTLTETRFDWLGMTTLSVALTTLALGLLNIEATHLASSLVSTTVWPWLLASLLAWVALIRIERAAVNPVFPTHLFSRRQLRIGFLLTAGAGFGEASLVFLPTLAVAALGLSVTTASFMSLPVVLAMSVGSPLAGRLLDAIGSRTVILVGVATMAVGMFSLSLTSGTWAGFIISGLLIGLGLSALLGAPVRYVALSETTAQDRSAAQGMVTNFTSIGMLIGGALVGAAATTATGAAGYNAAFALVGWVSVGLWLASLALKRRQVEAGSPQRETESTNA